MLNASTPRPHYCRKTAKERLRLALQLIDFDADAAKALMSVANRVYDRPADRPGVGRVSAVLILVYPTDDDLMVVYTKRPSSLRDHSGQISFPGGKQESAETLEETALREAWEEVGVEIDTVEILGQQSVFYIPPSDFYVTPFVGWLDRRPRFSPNPAEVALLIEVPLRDLIDPAQRRIRNTTFKNQPVEGMLQVPYFDIQDQMIWGATAAITSEFVERWLAVKM